MKATATMTVIVFGAGPTGKAALHRIREDAACDVVAFADNAARRQGDTFEGLPVIAPETIPAYNCDRIVVASHGWPSIVAQLRALGVPEDRIHVHPVDAASAAAAMTARTDALSTHARPESDRIHYACGQRVLEGWLNVDGFDESYPNGCVHLEQSRRIVRMDLTAPHPFPDESFQWGYAEDFLEHLTQAESIGFLCEAYRTFKRGGVLRLSFPGLAGVLRRHLRSGGFAGAAVCVDEAYTRWFHEHFYTFDSLQLVASHIGFSDVRRCDYGHSLHQVLKQESRPDQADLNLVVELTK
jgi:predicted SAM-dependent methyltransferase